MSTWNCSIRPTPYGAVLVVEHSCGHEGRYLYGGAEVAQRDVRLQQTPKCLQCRSRDEIKRLTALLSERKKLTLARLAPDSEVTP